MKVFKNKKILKDFVLSFAASFLMTGVTQLLLYPLLSRMMDKEQYGIILTVTGVVNTIVATVGGSLNNSRLVMNSKYDERNLRGDFNLLLIVLSVIGVLAFFIFSLFNTLSSIVVAVLCFFVLISTARNYGTVFFRMSLNYTRVLICSCLIAIGNSIGIGIVYFTKLSSLWPLAFALGEIFGVSFVLLKTNLVKEKPVHTPLMKETIKVSSSLMVATLMANILTYLDRLVLLPLLGAESVSIYSVASFLGKSFGVVMLPLSSVLLSYYSQKSFYMDRKKFWIINFLFLGIAVFFMAVCLFASRFITGLFYPTIIEDASPFLLVANAASILITVGSMTQPAVLKYAKARWQIVIQSIYLLCYLGFGFLGSKMYGLFGFGVAAIIAALVRIFVLYIVGQFSIHKETIAINIENNKNEEKN